MATFGITIPSLQIDSGGKSIHSYWVFDNPIDKSVWKTLQADLLEFSDADRSIKNPSRVMRLAGCYHSPAKNDNQSKIITNSGKRYSFEELRSIIPSFQAPTSSPKAVNNSSRLQASPDYQIQPNDEVPLDVCLTKHDRTLIKSGVSEGGRNVNGAKLARNILGTAKRLQYLGIRFSGDPRQLFDDYCSRCNPAIDVSEADKIWVSAEKDNPSATLTDDAIENCVKAYWRNQKLVPAQKGKVKRSSEKEHNEYNVNFQLPPDFEPNQWDDVPQSHNGELGYWKKKDDNWHFDSVCNFDFVIEMELEDSQGGGFVLQFKRSLDSTHKRVIINSLDYTTPDRFLDKLKQEVGVGIVSKLNRKQLAGLIQTRLIQYKTSGRGRIYKQIECYGQQPDGTWVLKNKQFKKDGTPTTEEESGWVYNPSLGKEDKIPCPELAEEDPQALTKLVNAARPFFGHQNFHQLILQMGWTVASLQFQEIFKAEGNFPIFNGFGVPGALKTLAAETCLSLIGKNWASDAILSSISASALYEHGSKTSSLPFVWDDPQRSKENEELVKKWFNCKSRKVRGNEQTPKSPLALTSNHVVGGEQEATLTRIIRACYEKITDGSNQNFQELRKVQNIASGAFSSLIKIGYPQQQIKALEAEFLPYLPLAHARIAKSLAIVTWYAQHILRMVGAPENIKQWVIDNICPQENDEDNTGDSLEDFIKKLLVLEAESIVGDWNLKRGIERDGKKFVAIYAQNCWKLVDQKYNPATYNEKSLKPLVLKAGGNIRTTVRFYSDRDQTLAYKRALITGNEDFKPSKPDTKPRTAWLVPEELFEKFEPNSACNHDAEKVINCNRELITTSINEESRIEAPYNSNCNHVIKNNNNNNNKEDFDGVKNRQTEIPPPTSPLVENPKIVDIHSQDCDYTAYGDYNEQETTENQSFQPVINQEFDGLANDYTITQAVELVKKAIINIDSEALQQYSNQWTSNFKKEVLSQLSQEEKQALKKLVKEFKTETYKSAPKELFVGDSVKNINPEYGENDRKFNAKGVVVVQSDKIFPKVRVQYQMSDGSTFCDNENPEDLELVFST
ncbi:MAG: hypothetical protein HC836_36285 [Richelia sp. RM2_1_2]|nr:hypothetical protein [Richelia sp. SM1_7_0]NJO27296.1 hypothetical protein [Richelia sp. SL_2_1]NJO63463.1 hypothetical protein [Richelia sp. RM2_1_2]